MYYSIFKRCFECKLFLWLSYTKYCILIWQYCCWYLERMKHNILMRHLIHKFVGFELIDFFVGSNRVYSCFFKGKIRLLNSEKSWSFERVTRCKSCLDFHNVTCPSCIIFITRNSSFWWRTIEYLSSKYWLTYRSVLTHWKQ